MFTKCMTRRLVFLFFLLLHFLQAIHMWPIEVLISGKI